MILASLIGIFVIPLLYITAEWSRHAMQRLRTRLPSRQSQRPGER
jgi:hypothetical protein